MPALSTQETQLGSSLEQTDSTKQQKAEIEVVRSEIDLHADATELHNLLSDSYPSNDKECWYNYFQTFAHLNQTLITFDF
jgi:hypothetical protein